jgi:hypothetical protein
MRRKNQNRDSRSTNRHGPPVAVAETFHHDVRPRGNRANADRWGARSTRGLQIACPAEAGQKSSKNWRCVQSLCFTRGFFPGRWGKIQQPVVLRKSLPANEPAALQVSVIGHDRNPAPPAVTNDEKRTSSIGGSGHGSARSSRRPSPVLLIGASCLFRGADDDSSRR